MFRYIFKIKFVPAPLFNAPISPQIGTNMFSPRLSIYPPEIGSALRSKSQPRCCCFLYCQLILKESLQGNCFAGLYFTAASKGVRRQQILDGLIERISNNWHMRLTKNPTGLFPPQSGTLAVQA
jgi:hypothetical protein